MNNEFMATGLRSSQEIRELVSEFQEELKGLEGIREFLELARKASLLGPLLDHEREEYQRLQSELVETFRLMHLCLFRSICKFFSEMKLRDFSVEYGEAALLVMDYLSGQDMLNQDEIDFEISELATEFWDEVLDLTIRHSEFRPDFLYGPLYEDDLINKLIDLKMKKIQLSLSIRSKTKELERSKSIIEDINMLVKNLIKVNE